MAKKPKITPAQIVADSRMLLSKTQARFAKRFRVHPNTVSRWETGTYDVPSKVILALLEQFETLKCPRCNGRGVI